MGNSNISNINNGDKPADKSNRIGIIGFGNIMMGDDGIGVRVIDEIKRQGIFNNYKNIELMDGGTSGVDLIFILQNIDKAIIVDAVNAGQEIGEIAVFKTDEIKKMFKKNSAFRSFSFHDIELTEIFELLKTLNINAEIKIIGINPENVGYSNKLSSIIESKIPEIISEVKKEVAEFNQDN